MKIENNNAIPIIEVEEQINVFGYSSALANLGDVADSGVVVTDPDEQARLMRMNLSPYRKKLDKEPVIRYLYTGREYNIETGDYYYRARVMDASVGRFGSKDLILFLNRYNYVANNPLYFIDIFGNAYFAKIGLTGGEYDLSDEGSSADQRNLQWVHEGILWDDGEIWGFKLFGGYQQYGTNLLNSGFGSDDRDRYTITSEWYDDNLLYQSVNIVNSWNQKYKFFSYNCQDWSTDVRFVYWALSMSRRLF